MKLNSDYRLREIAGQYLLIYEGTGTVNMSAVYSFSESAAWMWQRCEGRRFTEDQMVRWLLDEYEVEEDIAREDVKLMIESWTEYGFLKEK